MRILHFIDYDSKDQVGGPTRSVILGVYSLLDYQDVIFRNVKNNLRRLQA